MRRLAEIYPPDRVVLREIGLCDGLQMVARAPSTHAKAEWLIDGSLSGLGGCPFAPGATGNVAFEDLGFLCERKGFPTGIDLEKLIAVREIVASEMPEEELLGALPRAGTPRQINWRATNPSH